MNVGSDILVDVVTAFVRSIRAMGYYDESHPVFAATRDEAYSALRAALQTQPLVTLGGAGRHLLIDEQGRTLTIPPAVALASRMFENAVVAVRFRPDIRVEDLGLFMQVLAEREDRVRAAGGMAAVLQRQGVGGIEVVEVDIEALFAGRQADLGRLAGDDPVVELAMRALLRFRDQAQDNGSEALHVSLEQVGSPASLGHFLDELLQQAEPGVVDHSLAPTGHLTGDDLADLASQAYLRSHAQAAHAATAAQDIAYAAELLSNALVRLAPDARFALLRRLAGADTLPDAAVGAVQNLGSRVDDGTVTAAIAAALFEQQGDPITVRSVGNLIRRIRPIEVERHRLLAAVDRDMRDLGRPLDGALWQQMQSRAFENSALGMLEMSLTRTRQALQDHAMARRAGRMPPVAGQDVLHTVDNKIVEYWTTHALVDLLNAPGRFDRGAVQTCRQQLERLDRAGATDECMVLLMAMMRRTERDASEALNELIVGLLEGPQSAKWGTLLLHYDGPSTQQMADVLLAALDQPGERTYKSSLVERLARFDDHRLLRLVHRHGPRVSPLQAQSLVLASLRRSSSLGVKIGRLLLRYPTPRVREVVLKTMVERPEPEVVSLLAHVAGWRGERYTKALLGLDGHEGRGVVLRAQLTAIGALGLTRSGLAAQPLLEILVRSRMFGDREQEELRVAAAQALRTNATPKALGALREARGHKKRVIRETVERVLGRGDLS